MKKISNSERQKLAQRFFALVYNHIEEGTDFIYEELDPDCEYDGEELCREFNNDTILEVLRIGFLWKYGEDLKCGNIKEGAKKVCTSMNKEIETGRFLKITTYDLCKKMREALEKIASMGEQIDYQLGSSEETVYMFRHERCLAHNISECARDALSIPPRNCDLPLVVDGPADNAADNA